MPQQVLSPAHHERADVVGLEEPFVWIDGDAVGSLEARHPLGVARGEAGGAPVGGIDVQPDTLAVGDVGQARRVVDRAGVRRPGDGGDRERRVPGGPVAGDRLGDRPGLQAEALVAVDHDQRVVGEAEHAQRPRDREVGLIAHVHARPLQVGASRRGGRAPQLREPDVAGDGHGHDVGHHPPAGQHTPAVGAEPDEVTQPRGDLLFDERSDGTGVPHVDPLMDPLREHLSRDRSGEGRWGEVAERAGVLCVEGGRRDALAELGEHVAPRAR